MISIAANVMAMGAPMAMIAPQARTCRHGSVFVGRASVGNGMGSGQKSAREGATIAG